jgi:hypothetical protein
MAHSAASRIGILRSKVFGGAESENPLKDLGSRTDVAVPKNRRLFIISEPWGDKTFAELQTQSTWNVNSDTLIILIRFSDFPNYGELS